MSLYNRVRFPPNGGLPVGAIGRYRHFCGCDPSHASSQGVNSPPELTPFYLQTRNGRPGSLASRPYAASRSFLSNPDCTMRIDRAS